MISHPSVRKSSLQNKDNNTESGAPAVHYKRSFPRKKMGLQNPPELGCELEMSDLASKVTTPKCKLKFHRSSPDVEISMKLRDTILKLPRSRELDSKCLLAARECYRSHVIDSCLEFRSDILESFADGNNCENGFITFFGQCLMLDDYEEDHLSASYRLILPASLSQIILCEDYFTGAKYSPEDALFLLEDLCDPLLISNTKLVLFPVHHGNHWSVYYVNLIHRQIDILDSYSFTSAERNEYHGSIFYRIRSRLNDMFRTFSKGRFPDFSNWGLPYVPVPKQVLQNDCGFFVMMFLKHYDGENRKLGIDINPLLGLQYRAQILYYILFHKRNGERPLPAVLEVLAPGQLHAAK